MLLYQVSSASVRVKARAVLGMAHVNDVAAILDLPQHNDAQTLSSTFVPVKQVNGTPRLQRNEWVCQTDFVETRICSVSPSHNVKEL